MNLIRKCGEKSALELINALSSKKNKSIVRINKYEQNQT